MTPLPPLPHSWSELSWKQLCDAWSAKMRYAGYPDIARVAAFMALCNLTCEQSGRPTYSQETGERTFVLCSKSDPTARYNVTAREISHYAEKSLHWFDFPYGDPGEKEERDESGKVTKERREPVAGCVSPMRDAMILPETEVYVSGKTIRPFAKGISSLLSRAFALPQAACNNLTWQQYRALQVIVPQLFDENADPGQTADLQAQFLAHCLIPRSLALLDTSGGSMRIRLHWEYKYDSSRAESMVPYWRKKLLEKQKGRILDSRLLFHVCFQCYQTAVLYYSISYPLLFSGDSKNDTMRDALMGEVGTINTIMKYAGYGEQQQVYDSNLPFVLDILNTMTKEAKEIEKMNSKIKKK